jgi:glycosyltransferase involved in cell wall biosynthesis
MLARVASDVAVITPCFNHGEFLAEGVASALAQEGPGGPPEVVVIDDGSTDPETIAAIDALPPEVKVVRQENAGRAAARNAGVAATDAKYLLMSDADDLLPPGVMAELRNALEADPRAGFAYGKERNFGAWEGVIEFPPWDPFKELYRPIAWMGMVRREAFEQAGGFDPEIGGYEDWDLLLGMIEHGWGAAQIDSVGREYRRGDGSALSGDRGRYREIYRRIRRKHRALYKRSGELARQSDLSLAGRALYRTFWAWRPVPARAEQWLYSKRFGRA